MQNYNPYYLFSLSFSGPRGSRVLRPAARPRLGPPHHRHPPILALHVHQGELLLSWENPVKQQPG